jgi:hypothetical protein
MVAMMRPSKKARKIAFDILGRPQSMSNGKEEYSLKKKKEGNSSGQSLLIPSLIGK